VTIAQTTRMGHLEKQPKGDRRMERELSFSVNLDSPIAVYVQIENQIQFAVAAGRLKAGDILPSVRDMSAAVNVNPNTVTKAYRDLELRGVVRMRRGIGVTVSDKGPKLCREKTRAMVCGRVNESVAECLASGMSPSDVRKLVSTAIDSGRGPYEVR